MTGERAFDVIVPSVVPLKGPEYGVSTAGAERSVYLMIYQFYSSELALSKSVSDQ